MLDLKDKKKTIEERAKSMLQEQNISENIRANGMSLTKGDKFTLTSIQKPSFANQQPNPDFQLIMVLTNIGATTNIRHFNRVAHALQVRDKNAPALGSTALEVAKWVVYCIQEGVEFVCKSVKVLPETTLDNGRKYKPKEYKIELSDEDEDEDDNEG